MSKKAIFYTGFFVVLAVGFYFILVMVIPGFGQRKVEPVSYVRPFSFTNQDGQKVTDADVKGKVYVVEYFFTSCRGICPMMNNNMRKVYDALHDNPDFRILSHTCDPAGDSAARLKRYADSLGVNTKTWMFLTGRKDSLYTMARLSYTIDDPKNNLKSIDDDFLHTQNWALVDREGNVVAIYDGLKPSEIRELIREAKGLLKRRSS